MTLLAKPSRFATWMAVLASAGLCAAGCNQPVNPAWEKAISGKGQHEPEPEIESNIVRVNKFFSQTPWLSFTGDGSKKVDGVSFSVYLEGPSAPKGVFGTGTIAVIMYRLNTDPNGRETATQVYEWVLRPEESYLWRAKAKTALGWGYGLRLQWPEDLDVDGRRVAFVVKYIREDGRVVNSSRQVIKVPSTQIPAPSVS